MISKEAKEKIKEFEGCRLKAYKCPAGVWTIGYGHTGEDVRPGMKITQAVADELFDKDVSAHENQVANLLKKEQVKNLTQNQYDSLISFSYNVGIGNLSKSTLFKKVKANPNDESIGREFYRWCYAGGRALLGLMKRREWEAKHYMKDAPTI